MPCASVSAKRTRISAVNGNASTDGNLDQLQLCVLGKARDADADEPQRAGAVAERPVEEPARELADPVAVVGSGRE